MLQNYVSSVRECYRKTAWVGTTSPRLGICAAGLLVLMLCGCQPGKPAEKAAKLEGIVLFISDGTSQELISVARFYSQGARGRLALEDMAHSAFVRTPSANSLVTDSSAAATAIARGIKVVNGVVGKASVTDPGTAPSILDLARKAGWSTGVVSDDSLTGATPASFLVENNARSDSYSIAEKIVDQLGRRADVVLGGGARFFTDDVGNPAVFYYPGVRQLSQRVEGKLREKGVRIFKDWDALKEYAARPDDRPVVGLFAPESLPYYADGKRTLRLKDMVEQAVAILRARNRPFFLMVEAGLPDKACHQNNAKRAITEVLELDAAIDWVRRNVPNVLVLATTDHNTGGLIFNGYPPIGTRGDALLGPAPSNQRPILTWASGPGFDRTNTRTRIVSEPDKPWQEVTEEKTSADPDYRQPALIEGRSALHTGGDVWLLADGPGAETVHGYMENTDIFRVMADAIEGSKP
jgi:alkaline phosphatase